MHMVLFPHIPLVVTWSEPVGITTVVVEVEVCLVVVLDVVCEVIKLVVLVVLVVLAVLVVREVLVVLVLVLEVVVCTTLGHPHVPYCGWQSKSGWQWSTESPQKP